MRETPAKHKFGIFVGGVAHTKLSSDGAGPAKSRGPVVPWLHMQLCVDSTSLFCSLLEVCGVMLHMCGLVSSPGGHT